MKLPEFCETLTNKLQQTPAEERLEMASLALQQAFKVAEDEVAFLVLNEELQTLNFVWPKRLIKAGSIPVKTRDSLAAETVRNALPQINNRFTSTQHASIFELVKLNTGKQADSQRPSTIQKVMSAPLLAGDTLVGVVQVSRKAEDANLAGPDFTEPELEALSGIARVIGSHL